MKKGLMSTNALIRLNPRYSGMVKSIYRGEGGGELRSYIIIFYMKCGDFGQSKINVKSHVISKL